MIPNNSLAILSPSSVIIRAKKPPQLGKSIGIHIFERPDGSLLPTEVRTGMLEPLKYIDPNDGLEKQTKLGVMTFLVKFKDKTLELFKSYFMQNETTKGIESIGCSYAVEPTSKDADMILGMLNGINTETARKVSVDIMERLTKLVS